MTIYMKRARNVDYRLREQKGVWYRARHHDQANTTSMMGRSRVKQVYWLLGGVEIRVVIDGPESKQNRLQV